MSQRSRALANAVLMMVRSARLSRSLRLAVAVAGLVFGGNVTAAPPAITAVEIEPSAVHLRGPAARYSLLVNGTSPDGRSIDLTGEAVYASADAEIVAVDASGRVRSVRDGSASVIVGVAGHTVSVPVVVEGSHHPRAFSFPDDVMPILERYGCSGAGCHGKAEGKGGFRLSVFSSDPRADYEQIARYARGRRVFPASPERSLLLLKATNTWPHSGGARFDAASPEYETLKQWIAAGLPYGSSAESTVVRVEISPKNRVISIGGRQQLRLVAHLKDGRRQDVTKLARYLSNSESIASVSDNGLVTVLDRPGQVAIMAGFLNRFDVFTVLVPRPQAVPDAPDAPAQNFIDDLVHARLRDLNLVPSAVADDAEFLRRVFLDVIGTLPTAAEVRSFLEDSRPDRRARIVDALLERPEYATYWALKWSDVLHVTREKLGHKGAYEFYKWIRDSFAANMPYDRLAREVVTARGVLTDVPAGHFYKVVGKPGAVASELSQVFLGLRIACAECHHHPSDVWTQTDYFGMQSFFTQVKFRGTTRGEVVFTEGNPETKHPRTGEVVLPHPLGTPVPGRAPDGDRRSVLADWLVSGENPWFARNLVNRMWAHLMGGGLIEPVDDLRVTNPSTNPELLAALADHFVASGYDLHELIRTITKSRTYQLSSTPNETNANDEQSFSRAILRPLEAEVLLDAVCQATGVPEKFDGVPAGYRAIELWDSSLSHYFLRIFGRPVRESSCVCERIPDASVGQALHLMNSPRVHTKLAHSRGTVARLEARHQSDEPLVDELYLTFYNRHPDDAESRQAIEYLRSAKDRRHAAEDLAWSMLCSIEFVFRH